MYDSRFFWPPKDDAATLSQTKNAQVNNLRDNQAFLDLEYFGGDFAKFFFLACVGILMA